MCKSSISRFHTRCQMVTPLTNCTTWSGIANTVRTRTCEAGGAHLTKPGWSKPHTHSNPTNLALFRHKITPYRFNQGVILLQVGLKWERGAEPPESPHFNHRAEALSANGHRLSARLCVPCQSRMEGLRKMKMAGRKPVTWWSVTPFRGRKVKVIRSQVKTASVLQWGPQLLAPPDDSYIFSFVIPLVMTQGRN